MHKTIKIIKHSRIEAHDARNTNVLAHEIRFFEHLGLKAVHADKINSRARSRVKINGDDIASVSFGVIAVVRDSPMQALRCFLLLVGSRGRFLRITLSGTFRLLFLLAEVDVPMIQMSEVALLSVITAALFRAEFSGRIFRAVYD